MMNCRPGRHEWEIIVLEQDQREIRFRRCQRPGCERWDELRVVWTAIELPPVRGEVVA